MNTITKVKKKYLKIHPIPLFSGYCRESPRDTVANMLYSDIIVSEFELQSRYYVHFQINNLGKCHHHHIVLGARISLTLSRHSSLSFIALGRSSGQQPVSSHSCWMYVRAGRPAFARPCVGIHKSTSLMSSSLLLQQCPACLVRLSTSYIPINQQWVKYCHVCSSRRIALALNNPRSLMYH